MGSINILDMDNNENICIEIIKKKRGRKPKPKLPEDDLPKIPKKRGRKPKDRYGIVPKNLTLTAPVNNDNEHIILHLPIRSSQIGQNQMLEKTLLEYNPELNNPLPFESDFNASPYPFNNS